MPLPRRLSEPGPLIEYIAWLQRTKQGSKAREVIDAVRNMLRTPEGAIFLDFLDKAVLERSLAISADPRALDANNAQSFIALDLRRILSDEHNEQNEPIPPDVGTTGRGKSPGGSRRG